MPCQECIFIVFYCKPGWCDGADMAGCNWPLLLTASPSRLLASKQGKAAPKAKHPTGHSGTALQQPTAHSGTQSTAARTLTVAPSMRGRKQQKEKKQSVNRLRQKQSTAVQAQQPSLRVARLRGKRGGRAGSKRRISGGCHACIPCATSIG